MVKELIRAFLVMSVFTIICGLCYPFSTIYLSNKTMPRQAEGSFIYKKNKSTNKESIIGSVLIGQEFNSEKYFHSRPSTSSSVGSNLGPTNKELLKRVSSRVQTLRNENLKNEIPIDLVTESASGLDPNISISSAYFQVPRIAKARGISEDALKNIVKKNIENKYFGILGEKRITVLKLNLDLDKVTQWFFNKIPTNPKNKIIIGSGIDFNFKIINNEIINIIKVARSTIDLLARIKQE